MGEITMNITTNENKTERIMDVDLSMRAKNILRREGIHTIDDLCNLNRMELSVLRGCGPKTEKEILDAIRWGRIYNVQPKDISDAAEEQSLKARRAHRKPIYDNPEETYDRPVDLDAALDDLPSMF